MRLGLVGSNFVSDWLCRAALNVPDVTLCAIYSRTREAGGAFADAHGIPAVFTDYDAFLASGLDAVYLASPNSCHEAQARQALLSGVSVLCEKPAVLSEKALCSLVALAQEKKLVFMEAMRPLHDPGFSLIRQYLPALGPLRSVHLDYCQYSSRYDRFKAGELPNAFNPALGNAAVLDIGVYPLALAAALFGRPCSIQASSFFLPGGMESAGSVLLRYEGFTVTVTYSKVNDSPCRCFLGGEAGTLTFARPAKPEQLVLTPRGGAPEPDPYTAPESNMVYELADFVAALKGADIGFFTKASLDTAYLLDGVRRAWQDFANSQNSRGK